MGSVRIKMFWVIVVLCLGLVIGEGLGEECGDKNRQFGDNSVVFGENELGEEDSVALERTRRSFYRSGAALGKETSQTLDYLLSESGYNRRIRPTNDGGPVAVNVNLAIRSMGPVDENREAYSLDCYFRQSWLDRRLSYNTSGLSEL